MTSGKTTPEEEQLIEQEFEALLLDYSRTSHRQKVEIITRAFHFAKQAHDGVRRKSGEPYIMHPLAVARIVVKEIGLGSTSICSALLHDVVEDTEYTVEDIRQLFGDKIASIVDGLTKIAGGLFGEQASLQAENFRKLILTMSEDVRVVLIKIADRLHNMRTLEFQPKEKQFKIAGETQYIYAPLAHRLGLFPIKTELENLSFKYQHPDLYAQIEQRLQEKLKSQMESYETFIVPIREALDMFGYTYKMEARIKTPYSIWKKMQDKDVTMDEMYDLMAVRIIFEPNTDRSEKDQCWTIYSSITEIYKPHPERIRDWISTPKSNGYEALHVTVMGNNGEWVEVQIRTTRMHEIAEKGLAAHWKYKTGEDDSSELDKWLREIKDLLKKPVPNASDFLDDFKLNLFASEIFVFTPQGDIKTFPLGATALDFAFNLHTQIGEHCIGAKVNHKLEPLSYKLNSGDQIEILTSTNQHPQKYWLNWVTTAKAQSRLKDYFRKEDRTFIRIGEQLFEDELVRLKKTDSRDMAMHRLLNYYGFKLPQHMMLQLGKGVITLAPLQQLLEPKKKRWWQYIISQNDNSNDTEETQTPVNNDNISKQKTKHIVLTDFNRNIEYKLASCCNPIPGDEVFAYRDQQGMYIVHKMDCPKADKIKSHFGKTLCTAEWRTQRTQTFVETIEIQGIDHAGVMIQVLEVISNHFKCNLKEMHIVANDGIFNGTFQLHVFDTEEINLICGEIGKISEINHVHRLKSSPQNNNDNYNEILDEQE